MKKLEPPEGMTDDDKVCNTCFTNLPKNKEYEKQKALDEKQKAIEKEEKEKQKMIQKEHDQELKKEIDEIKSHFQKGSTILYKDEYCAILKKIDDLAFVKAFRNLTREGYRLMAQDEGGQFHLGIASVGAGSYYFFQKIEYVTPKK